MTTSGAISAASARSCWDPFHPSLSVRHPAWADPDPEKSVLRLHTRQTSRRSEEPAELNRVSAAARRKWRCVQGEVASASLGCWMLDERNRYSANPAGEASKGVFVNSSPFAVIRTL